MVITGDAEFFVITKRLHNQIHGEAAGGPLTAADAGHYARMLAANAVELLEQIRPGDLVLLHDPQTAGLTAAPDAGRRARGLALPHRRGLGERRHRGRVELPAAASGRRARVRVLPARVRAVVDPGREGRDHPAVDRPVLAEEPVPRRRHRAAASWPAIGVLDGAAAAGPTSFTRRDGGTGRGAPGGRDHRRRPARAQAIRWSSRSRAGTSSRTCPAVMRGFADYVAPGRRRIPAAGRPSRRRA